MSPFKNKSEKVSTETEYISRIRRHIDQISQQLRKHMEKDGCEKDRQVKPFKVGERVMAKVYPTQKGIQFARYDGPWVVIEVARSRQMDIPLATSIDKTYYRKKLLSSKADRRTRV